MNDHRIRVRRVLGHDPTFLQTQDSRYCQVQWIWRVDWVQSDGSSTWQCIEAFRGHYDGWIAALEFAVALADKCHYISNGAQS